MNCRQISKYLYFCKGQENGCQANTNVKGENPFEMKSNVCAAARFVRYNIEAVLLELYDIK